MESATTHTAFAPPRKPAQAGVFAIARSPSNQQPQEAEKTSRLVLRDLSGQIRNSWVLNQSKITLGSSPDCLIQCAEPGIQPIHCLIVPGSRQLFVRALGPNVSQDGIPASELLLNAQRNHFEVAGVRFEFLPSARPDSLQGDKSKQSERLRFTTVRPIDLSRTAPVAASAKKSAKSADSEITIADTPWLNRLIQKTIEPLESQIQSLLLPVTECQAKVLEAENQRKAEAVDDQQQSGSPG
jgi:hypothetical protein